MKSCQISVKWSVVSVSGKALGACCRMAVWQLNRRNHRLFSWNKETDVMWLIISDFGKKRFICKVDISENHAK